MALPGAAAWWSLLCSFGSCCAECLVHDTGSKAGICFLMAGRVVFSFVCIDKSFHLMMLEEGSVGPQLWVSTARLGDPSSAGMWNLCRPLILDTRRMRQVK